MVQTIQNGLHPAIRAKLLQSGHYSPAGNGRLRSNYLYSDRSSVQKRFMKGYPCLIAGNIEDIKPGHSAAHEHGLDDYSKGVWHMGLENCVRIEEPGITPAYVVDCHRFAYYAWQEALALGDIKMGSILVHIDQHYDSDVPMNWRKIRDLKMCADFSRFILANAGFILPAVAQGLVSEFWHFYANPLTALNEHLVGELMFTTREAQHTAELADYFSDLPCPEVPGGSRHAFLGDILLRQRDRSRLIIDTDLDCQVPFNCVQSPSFSRQLESAARFLAEISKKGGVATIATSPGYADQEVAINFAQQIVGNMLG